MDIEINTDIALPGKGLIVCVSGPSGVGKGTVIAELLSRRTTMTHSVSITTRAPRPGEYDGVSYYFRKKEDFERMLREGEILEYDCYCDNYYGTPKTPLEQMVNAGTDVLMDITVPGSLTVMENYPEAITLFLLPPSFTELERRLRKRGTECEDILARRLQNAREEIGKANLFQYVIINDDLEQTANKILTVVEAEHCRYQRLAGIESMVLAR